MTDFDRFELQFAAALRSDADLSMAPFEPEQIARAAMTGSLRQTARPAFPLPVRAPRPAARFGRGRGITLLAAALVVVGGTAAVGSGLLRPPALPPSLTAVPTTSPAVESSSPINTPSPAPIPAGFQAQAGQFEMVCDFRLVSSTVGWVATPSALYRSENQGQAWSAVEPRGWTGARPSLFIDADTAYTYVSGSPAAIARTHDGGATWAETTLGESPDNWPAFSFQTPTTGSLIFLTNQKNISTHIYTTTDGGATWTGPRSGPGEQDTIVRGFCGHKDAAGVLARTIAPGTYKPEDRLQISHDAGITWIDRPLPIKGTQVAGVWGDDSGRIIMALHGSDFRIYTSADDGRSWHLATTMGAGQGGTPEFLSPTEWILVSGSVRVMSTVDGGAHWRTIVGSQNFWMESTSFASPDLGWGFPTCGQPAFAHTPLHPACGATNQAPLLQTTDGGQTWAQVGR